MVSHHYIHPIEQESYAIIQPLIDTLDQPVELLPLAARVLHATTDIEMASTLCSTEGAVDMAASALALGLPIITDVEMTRSGINRISRERTVCALSLQQADIPPDSTTSAPNNYPESPALSMPPGNPTRGPAQSCNTNNAIQPLPSRHAIRDAGLRYPDAADDSLRIFPSHTAHAMWLAAAIHPHDALYVIGCAPTALDQLLDMIEAGNVHPAAVIALPVGFVGAEDAKKRLMTVASTHSIPAITNSGPKGGSAATAACVNALHMLGSHRSLQA